MHRVTGKINTPNRQIAPLILSYISEVISGHERFPVDFFAISFYRDMLQRLPEYLPMTIYDRAAVDSVNKSSNISDKLSNADARIMTTTINPQKS